MKRFKWPVLVLALLLIVPTAGWYLWQRAYFPGTDDAYLNANVVRIAARIAGPVIRVDVTDQQAVHGRAARADWTGMALMIAGIGSLQLVLDRGDQEDWFNSGLIAALTLTCLLGLTAFVLRGWRRAC